MLVAPYTALVSLLALLVYLALSINVSRARRRFGVAVPAVAGHAEFERYIRVQQNTLEQIVLFLPSLWLFALTVGDVWAALIGLIWPIGRILYARGYYQAPANRAPGFIMTVVPSIVLLVGALIGVLGQTLF